MDENRPPTLLDKYYNLIQSFVEMQSKLPDNSKSRTRIDEMTLDYLAKFSIELNKDLSNG